eukprot:2266478-Rhodomonas_salina.1
MLLHTDLLTAYAMSGTDLRYAATRCTSWRRPRTPRRGPRMSPSSLCSRYAMSGTDKRSAHDAMLWLCNPQ